MKPSTQPLGASIAKWLRQISMFVVVLLFAILVADRIAGGVLSGVIDFVLPDRAYTGRLGKVVHSPDARFKAVLFFDEGGNGFSSYCFDYVSVAPASVADDATNQKAYRVYAGSCHNMGFGHVQNKPSTRQSAPVIKWSSTDVLDIVFDATEAKRNIRGFVFRDLAIEGQVRIVHIQFIEAKQ